MPTTPATADRQHAAPRQHEIPQDIPVTPKMYQRLAQKIAGKPEERILAHLMLRSLKQAHYSEKNEGHFALATSHYTHFTSPIRRYPDLIIHRISKALLHSGADNQVILNETSRVPHPERSEGSDSTATNLSEDDLSSIARESSDSERRAAEAERELIEWKKVKFMQHRIGEDFDAMVMNATKYGLFVELADLFIEGLVPLGSLLDDIYTYRENTRQIIGSSQRPPLLHRRSPARHPRSRRRSRTPPPVLSSRRTAVTPPRTKRQTEG